MYHSLRIILQTLAFAYVGFLVAGQASRTINSRIIFETVLGAVLGCLLAIFFGHRARRKHLVR